MIMILLVCILLYGVNIRIDFNDKLLMVMNVYIFGRLRIAYFRVRMHDSKLYWKFNSKPYRLLSLSERGENTFKYISYKKIEIFSLKIVTIYGSGEDALNPLKFVMMFTLLTDLINNLDNDYYDIKSCSRKILPYYDNENIILHLFITMKFGIISLLYNIIISKFSDMRRRYAVRQSNR